MRTLLSSSLQSNDLLTLLLADTIIKFNKFNYPFLLSTHLILIIPIMYSVGDFRGLFNSLAPNMTNILQRFPVSMYDAEIERVLSFWFRGDRKELILNKWFPDNSSDRQVHST